MAGKIVAAGIWMPLDTYSLLIETLLGTLNWRWPLAEHRLARNSVSCREAYAASIYSKSDPHIVDLGFKPGQSKWAGSQYQKRPGKKQSRQMCVVLVSYIYVYIYIYMDVSMFIPCHVMSPVPSFQHLWNVRWNQEVATSNKQELPISTYNTYTGCTYIHIYIYTYYIHSIYIYTYYIHYIYIYYHLYYTIYICYIIYTIVISYVYTAYLRHTAVQSRSAPGRPDFGHGRPWGFPPSESSVPAVGPPSPPPWVGCIFDPPLGWVDPGCWCFINPSFNGSPKELHLTVKQGDKMREWKEHLGLSENVGLIFPMK